MRLAYLNQESDLGSLALRRGLPCLNHVQLDQIANYQQREVHPLNCAKMNAKPYPYFDGGLMKADVPGKFAFFSSRNNNFSNRDQKGTLCVAGTTAAGTHETCAADPATGVLQDQNQALSTTLQQRISRQDIARAACIDTTNNNAPGVANDQGATSCITLTTNGAANALGVETFTTESAANDAMGDGDKMPCKKISFFPKPGTTESYLALAVGLAFVGFIAAWASVYCFNRIQARREALKETKFEGQTEWKKVGTGDDKVI
jgi:hypothetical protein